MRKKLFLIAVLACAFFSSYGQTTDLIISEYGEGSSGNAKFIEIYNGTGATVNLVDYTLWKVVNGGTWPESTFSFATASLANGATIVIANNSTDVPGADEYNSGFCSWSGDDAVGLAKLGVLIDVIGTDGADPGSGWNVAGTTNGTVNNRLTRKSTVCSPNTNWTTSAGTNTTDSEWVVTSYVDGSANAGHTVSCASTPTITVTPTSVTGLNYIFGSGPSAEQTFTASGTNLVNDVTGNITLTAPANFEISTTSGSGFSGSVTLPQSGGAVASTTIYVRLASGLAVNTYNGNITADSNGATTQNVAVSGDVTAVIGGSCSELFISEYIEGGGNNKYIEIYNPTSSAITLTGTYDIQIYVNGSSTAGVTIPLSGTTGSIPAYGVFVLENSSESLG
ncbi:lamin tail domain-containing protein, partial [Lutibacter sp.]